MIKFFTDRVHYEKKFRKELFFLLKVFFNESSPEHIKTQYDAILSSYILTEKPENADFFVLPMSWNYYVKNSKEHFAMEFIHKVKDYNKPILSFVTGDAGVTPSQKDIYIFRPSGYQRKRLKNQHALPVFINDPLKKYYNRSEPFLRKKTLRPVIGFCGQASLSKFQTIKSFITIAYKNIKYSIKLSVVEPQSLYPPVLIRSECLKILKSSKYLDTNFIIRKNYRAGANRVEIKKSTSLEFYENMINSDYVLCVRGAGNFSARLYESLAMGKIPVFINTDCVLPFENSIDWKSYVVWIEEHDLKKMPEAIMSFHKNLKDEEFEKLQISCRRLWEDYFSFNGYMNNFSKLFIYPSN